MTKELTIPELIEELQRLADEIDGVPTTAEMKDKGNFSPDAYYSRYDSWNSALKDAGLGSGKYRIMSEQELLDEIQRLADEIGRVPTTVDMEEHGNHDAAKYSQRFDGWRNAVEQAGYEPVNPRKIPKEELLSDLQRVEALVADNEGEESVYLTGDKYDEFGAYDSNTYMRRFGSWLDALEAANIPSTPRRDRGYDYDDDELLNEIQRLADECGRAPTASEMNEQGAFNTTTYASRFGSWGEAVELAGYEPNKPHQSIPRDELISELQRVADVVGHAPTISDMKERGAHSKTAYYNAFGSWGEAKAAAGLDS